MSLKSIKWSRIKCSKKELRLDITLKCGQSFRWQAQERNEEKVFLGVLKSNLFVLKQDDDHLYYSLINNSDKRSQEQFIKDYFNLGVNLHNLYQQWSKVDPTFLEISK